MREVTLRIIHHGEPECEVSARHPDVTIRSVSSMTGREAERKRIIELEGPTPSLKSFLSEFREAESVLEADPLSPLTGGHVYVALVVDAERWDSISERLSDMGIHYRMGTTINDGVERWTLYLDPDDDLSGVIHSLERGGNDVELARNVHLSEIDRPPELAVSSFLNKLTRRQREVLMIAIDVGYYDHGGGVGVEAIAEEIDLATTTVWEHLSRAEAKVMDGVAVRLPE